jgi:hypothetical protein
METLVRSEPLLAHGGGRGADYVVGLVVGLVLFSLFLGFARREEIFGGY